MNEPRIFISYSSKDRKIVKKIHEILANLDNLDIWRDETRLREDWSREIALSLADSDVLCLMWSGSAAASKWVEHEWLTARALEKRIIPILFPNAQKLPEPLYNLHGVHLEEENPKNACQEVAGRLRKSSSFNEPYDYSIIPANSNMPFAHNRYFTGRHVDLLELYLKMIGNLNNVGINQVGTVGMGGVGKTQLAVEFAYRFSFAFDSVHWIQAADVNHWQSAFVELARDGLGLSISEPDNPQAEKRYIFKLQKYCKENPQTLIIMDNVIKPELLNNDKHLFGLTPLTLGCNLLFTTRQHSRLHGVTSQAVDVLSPENAYMLLTHDRKPCTSEEEDHARAICNAVGYLPLAIVLAEDYLNEYKDVSFSDYHNELIKNKLDVIDIGGLSEEELVTRHVAAVGITLQEDWKRITDENAQLLFQLAGQFDEAEIIPKARLGLLSGIAIEKSKLDRPIDKAFTLLHSLSLAEKMESDRRSLYLHPLVRDFAQNKVPETEKVLFMANAAENLRTAYFDYTRLEYELKERGVGEMIDDLQIGIDWWEKGIEGLQDLRLLQDALRLSFNQLTIDSRQLAPHLISRLKDIKTPGIQKLLRDAVRSQEGPWFNPISRSLKPPLGPLLRTFKIHNLDVTAVAISQDGKTAISVSGDETLKSWDLSSGKEIDNPWDQYNGVSAVAISQDGKTAAFGSDNGTLKLWDLSNGKVLHTLEGQYEGVTAVAISPDGKTAVSCSYDRTLKVWDLSTGKVLQSVESGDHNWKVDAVAISPDGKTAAFGLGEGTLKLWDLTSGKVLQTLEGHNWTVNAVAISPDGKTLISGSTDLKLWDLTNGKLLHTLEGHSDEVTAVAIATDSKTAVSGSYDQTIKLWDLRTGQSLHTFYGHGDGVTAVAISADGKTAVSGADDDTLKLWDLSSNKSLNELPRRKQRGIKVLKGILHFYRRKRRGIKPALRNNLEGHSSSVNAVAISADGKTAISGSDDDTLKLWDLSSGKVKQTLYGHSDGIMAVAISSDGKIAVSSSNSTLELWDLTNGEALDNFEGHNRLISSVAICPDDKTAVSGSMDHTLKVWDLSTGKVLHTLEGHSSRVTAVAISADGKTAISGSEFRTLKVWDLSTGKVLQSVESGDHNWTVIADAVAFSPDGKTAAFGSDDGTLKLWDLTSGKLLQTLEGHSSRVTAVAISADGKTLISGSTDLKLWDLHSGKVITSFFGDSNIDSLAISSCGRIVIAGEGSGQVHFLRLEGI